MPQELKGNIRVFCRVRPLLEDEDVEESAVVQYPSSTELQGRAIELNQPSGRVRSLSLTNEISLFSCEWHKLSF